MEDDNNTASKLIEIKEILDFKENADYKRLSCDEIKVLRDYITNSQQENQELNDSITWWNNRFNAVQRDYEDYKSRIEKAVEYLKENEGRIYITKHINDEIFLENTTPQFLDNLNGRSDE